ncbi:TPA: hypothetical protein ACVDLI_000288 [Neisseria meningitidis]
MMLKCRLKGIGALFPSLPPLCFPSRREMGKVRMKLDGEDGLYGAAVPYRFEINLQYK